MFIIPSVMAFLEKVYENSMIIELRKLSLKCEKQSSHQSILSK